MTLFFQLKVQDRFSMREEIKKALEQEREKKLKLVNEQEINTDDVFENLGITKK